MFSIKLGNVGGGSDDLLGDLPSDLLFGASSDGLMTDLVLGETQPTGMYNQMEQQLWDDVVRASKPVPNVNPADLEEFSPAEEEEEEAVEEKKVVQKKQSRKKKGKKGKGGRSPALAPKAAPEQKSSKPKTQISPIVIKRDPSPKPSRTPAPAPTTAPTPQQQNFQPSQKPAQNKPKPKPKQKPRKNKSPALRAQPAPRPESRPKEQKQHNHNQSHRRQNVSPDDVVTISIADLTALLAKNNERLSEQIVQYMTSPRLFNAASLRTKLGDLQDSNVQNFLSSQRFKTAVARR